MEVSYLNIFLILFSYFVGSIQFEYLSKIYAHKIRKNYKFFSKKINRHIVRGIFKQIGLLFDILKCIIFIYLILRFFGNKQASFAAITLNLGHFYPIWSGFETNHKSLKTVIASGLIIHFSVGLFMLIVFLILLKQFKYKSLAVVGALSFGIAKSCLYTLLKINKNPLDAGFFILMGIIIIHRQKHSLMKILSGREKRLEFFKKKR